MRLTIHTDYALRTLIFLATNPQGGSVADVGRAYGISRHHLTKVVQRLRRRGFVRATPGRGGGLKLAQPAAEINLGVVVRATEPHFILVECFNTAENTCPITPACGLRRMLVEARDAFLAALDRYTLADVIGAERTELVALLRGVAVSEPAAPPTGHLPTASTRLAASRGGQSV